jgi:hypothetical protein
MFADTRWSAYASASAVPAEADERFGAKGIVGSSAWRTSAPATKSI